MLAETLLLGLKFNSVAGGDLTSLVSSTPFKVHDISKFRTKTAKVLFEEIILSILPAAFFLFLAPLRAVRLQKQTIKVRRSSLRIVKLVSHHTYPD